MLGPWVRVLGTWVAATTLIVLGVNAAIQRVADDVTIARPAPLTPDEVGRQLRERDRSPSATTAVDPALTERTTTVSSVPVTSTIVVGPTMAVVSTTAVGSTSRPGEPHMPDGSRPRPQDGPPSGAGTTTTAPRPTSGHPDEHQQPRGP